MNTQHRQVSLSELISAVNAELEIDAFKDYCPNGLQVQGTEQVGLIATAVTASQNIIDQAIAANADLLLVHHGYFWRNEAPEIVGMKYRRLSSLIKNDISLLAYHLPLDAHPVLGNNAQLAQKLNWQITAGLEAGNPRSIGLVGMLPEVQTLGQVSSTIHNVLDREPLVIGDLNKAIKHIAWCSGAAQGMLEQAAMRGCDLFVSGEISENTVHAARELGIAYISAGHHATERYGVVALGEWLSKKFGVLHLALDENNPV